MESQNFEKISFRHISTTEDLSEKISIVCIPCEEQLFAFGDVDLETSQKEVLDNANKLREKYNLPPFKLHSKLNDAAQKHSLWMSTHGLSHMEENNKDWATRCQEANYEGASLSTIGEDVGCGQNSPEQLISDFSKSPGHLKPLISNTYVHIGVGMAKSERGIGFWTIDFGYTGKDSEPEKPLSREDFNFT